MSVKAVFLDRDGTLNKDKNYLIKPEDFEFEENVPETLKYIYDKGYMLIVVSNQSGVARGYFTEEDVKKLHEFISEKISVLGFKIEKFYYCPHYEKGIIKEYSIRCSCRKPGTGMIEKAVQEFSIDLSQSFMIGDKEADMEAGKKSGLTTILVGTGYGKETLKTSKWHDHYFEDISGVRSVI